MIGAESATYLKTLKIELILHQSERCINTVEHSHIPDRPLVIIFRVVRRFFLIFLTQRANKCNLFCRSGDRI